MCVKLRV